MTYETDCPCGKVVAVHAADAGGTVRCACGRQLDVPALSRLRRLDPPPPPAPPDPVDYAFLRVPGLITTLAGFGVAFVVRVIVLGAEGAEAQMVGWVTTCLGWVAQIVGVALVCVSKRFPILLCVVLPLFGCCALPVAMLVPERLPPVPPPPR